MQRRQTAKLLALVLLTAIICVLSLGAGSSALSFGEIISALLGDASKQAITIVRSVRLPRTAAALCVGATLAMTGCVMQNVLRNPLASASTLGVAQGASFGAAVAIVWLGAGIQVNSGASGIGAAITITNTYLVTLCAFFGGIVTTIAILMLTRFCSLSPAAMALVGVAMSTLFTGGTALVQYFCDDVMVASVVYWTFGSLGRAGLSETALIFAIGCAALIFFAKNFWNYNAMESGDATAKSLGVNVGALVPVSMAVCTLASSAAVAFVGVINFVGLIAPHIARRIVGGDHRYLIPASAAIGASLMLAADIASRTLIAPIVLPIGALTSFLGAPIFLWMIGRRGAFGKRI